MLAREYNKRIELIQYLSDPDGYGGYIPRKEFIGQYWAKLSNLSTRSFQRLTDLGITDLYEPMVFLMRYQKDPAFNDLLVNGRDKSLMYQQKEFVIKSIIDVDMMHREVEITCTRVNPANLPSD